MKPLILEKEIVVLVDTDNTIAKWSKKHNIPGEGRIEFICPYSKEKIYLKPHLVHLRLIKQYKSRGYGVIVASKAGYAWSKEVVEKLGIEEYVDLIMTKPDKWVDDSDKAEDVIGCRVFLEDREDD